jgi:hypothetical protein
VVKTGVLIKNTIHRKRIMGLGRNNLMAKFKVKKIRIVIL